MSSLENGAEMLKKLKKLLRLWWTYYTSPNNKVEYEALEEVYSF